MFRNSYSKPGRLLFPVLVALGMTGCSKPKPAIEHNDFRTLEFGDFWERDFPFISTSLRSEKLGPSFPAHNVAPRGLAIRLGDSAYMCFDRDLLRWSSAWTGEGLPMHTMAQVSYHRFFNKKDTVPLLKSEADVALGNGMYAGWSEGRLSFRDPRTQPDTLMETFGPLPASSGRWEGVYTVGEKVILSYTAGSTPVLEMPGSISFAGGTAYTRTVKLNGPADSLFMVAAEVTDAVRSGSSGSGKAAWIYSGSAGDTILAIGVAGPPGRALRAGVRENRFLVAAFGPSADSAEPVEATIVLWRGAEALKDAFLQLLEQDGESLPEIRDLSAPPYWTEAVYTKGEVSPDTAAYVTDLLTLPAPNPWSRNVRVADIAFFENGDAAVSTFAGDVWLLEGIGKKLERLKWTRFASGLYEPMSLEIVDGAIYAYGKEGIVRLHDLNGDGVADFYENFFNGTEQSLHSREWASDMVKDPAGGFYIAKGGIGGSRQRGSIWKVSPDGRRGELFASGLRGPYLGIHPGSGLLTASDQQGNFVPSTPIMIVRRGDYFGYPTSPADSGRKITPPLVWIPHYVDPSSIGQLWITDPRMGPLNGQLIHFSHNRPGILRTLIDTTSGGVQGGVSFLPAYYPAPTHKGAINPEDGQLYIAGFNLWGSSSKEVSALLRLRYTGRPYYLPEKYEAGKQGIILRFGQSLQEDVATDPSNFKVKRWNYRRTSAYGSGHFKPDGSSGTEDVPVLDAYLSHDRKAVLVMVHDMKPVMQMQLSYRLKTSDGHSLEDDFWFTLKEVEDLQLEKAGFDDSLKLVRHEAGPAPAVAASKTPSLESGERLFRAMACAGCHSAGTETAGFYGPPFQGLYNSTRTFRDGTSSVADEAYLRESILEPAKRIVKGYTPEMPSFEGVLTETDIESILMYIKSLAGAASSGR